MLPAGTGSGEPLLLMDRSALACTVVRAVAVLLSGFESAVEDLVVAVLPIMLLSAVFALTCTAMLILAVAPEASDGLVQVTGPFVPTAGEVQVHPAGAVTDWNVVCAGNASPTLTLAAALGPALLTSSV